MHWYDRIYDPCKHSNGYSAPEAFYGAGKTTLNGCELQHKTFSYVDYRSGKPVRLYGIVDRYSSGADADIIISQIVGDLLPFDRTTDHILNNDPSDREIYCLLEELLRKIYQIDLNSNDASTQSYHASGSHGSPESSGNKYDNGSTLQMDYSPYEDFTRPNDEVISMSQGPLDPQINETVAQKLSVMEFLDFYKDIIQRVDEAARADERKYMNPFPINQANLIPSPANFFRGYMSTSPPQFQPPQFQNLQEYIHPSVEAASKNGCDCQRSPPSPPKQKAGEANRRSTTSGSNTTLPQISESSEKWWTEEGEYLTDPEQQLNFDFPDNSVIPQSIPSPFQLASVVSPVENARSSNDEEFLREIEKVASNLGYLENGEEFKESGESTSTKSDDGSSSTDLSSCSDPCLSFTATTIVFIYGNKMFVGSIGNSRVILLRQKCHYLDVMYLNEPPLAWYPVAAAKNSYIKSKHHILFQEPIVRGGFLINEYSVFLLMFNDGVISNMLKLNDYHHTSNEINRITVQMVVKILDKCPPEDIAQKFIAHMKHSCSRKYRQAPEIGNKREGMSFLFADLRPLAPPKPVCDHLLKNYQSKLNTGSPIQPYPKMAEYSYPHMTDERIKQNTSVDKVYNMFQEMLDRNEGGRRLTKNPGLINEDTWVFLRSDENET